MDNIYKLNKHPDDTAYWNNPKNRVGGTFVYVDSEHYHRPCVANKTYAHPIGVSLDHNSFVSNGWWRFTPPKPTLWQRVKRFFSYKRSYWME